MKRLAESFQGYDVVIIDGPAYLAAPDALDLAKDVDGVIIVARAQSTTSANIQSVCNSLESAGSKVLGVVLNQVSARKNRYSY
jgi:Mrp family chromosome partitioning ATPase